MVIGRTGLCGLIVMLRAEVDTRQGRDIAPTLLHQMVDQRVQDRRPAKHHVIWCTVPVFIFLVKMALRVQL